MLLRSINIENFRNLSQIKFEFNEHCNIICGKNGSGKTSLLEAIYYLILGRSFRSHLVRRIIRYQENSFSLFGKIQQNHGLLPVGVTRSVETGKKIKISGKEVSSNVEITKLAPIQLLDYSSYLFLHGPPKVRRQFIHWGLFHVKQSFLDLWRKAERTLEQRNIAICSKSAHNFITIWNKELARFWFEIHLQREQYINKFIPIAKDILQKILPDHPVNIVYKPGWNTDVELELFLDSNLKNDLQFGYTTAGPHRADIEIISKNIPAKDALSRGQQKLLLYGLQIAQGIILNQLVDKKCIYLVDDLPAELDKQKCSSLADILLSLKNVQIFATGLNSEELQNIFRNNSNNKIFHLSNGAFSS